jgi:carbon starvation protein CstA
VFTWLAVWCGVVAAWLPVFWLLAVRDPATPLPHIAAGPVLAAVFMAVQLPASLLATEAARAMHRRARARRERALVARLRRELAGP